MNKTVQLVAEWGQFESQHQDATLEDFCRYYLISQREKSEIRQNFSGIVPPDLNTYLAKLLGRIYQIIQWYSKMAIKPISELYNLDDFYLLNSIAHLAGAKKTDVIAHNLMGLSSGTDVLRRLLRNGLIEEQPSPNDKRARQMHVTPKGQEVLKKCYREFYKVNAAIFYRMSHDDKKLCIQLLKGVELRHTEMANALKTGTAAEMYESFTGIKEHPRSEL